MNAHLPAPRSKWASRLVNLAVAIIVLALAAATFVLSYGALHAIALQAGVSARLARGYPGLFDAVLVIACVAAVMLRDARWWARWWAWLVIIVVVAVVGAADAAHAMNAALPHRKTEGVVAAAPWVLVLLGFSLLLTILRHSRAVPASAVPAPAPDSAPGQRAARRTRKEATAQPNPDAPAAAFSPASPPPQAAAFSPASSPPQAAPALPLAPTPAPPAPVRPPAAKRWRGDEPTIVDGTIPVPTAAPEDEAVPAARAHTAPPEETQSPEETTPPEETAPEAQATPAEEAAPPQESVPAAEAALRTEEDSRWAEPPAPQTAPTRVEPVLAERTPTRAEPVLRESAPPWADPVVQDDEVPAGAGADGGPADCAVDP